MASITDKLRKLIAHEESARHVGSTAEAEAFAAKIHELMLKHKLEWTELDFEQQEKSEPIEEQWVSAGGFKNRRVVWQEILASTIAKHYFCAIVVRSYSNTIAFVGRKSDREVAMDMYRFLRRAAEEAAVREADDFLWDATASEVKRFKNSFYRGFAAAIGKRLSEQRKYIEQAASNSAALVLVRRSEAQL